MATIRPFRAIRPGSDRLHPLEHLCGDSSGGLQLDYLKFRLEPCPNGGLPGNAECRDFLSGLLAMGAYIREAHPALYIYERTSGGKKVTGIWALTSLEDLKKGHIARHELTLASKEAKLAGYRREVALEGAPIVLAYRNSAELAQLIQRTKITQKGFCYRYNGSSHHFWAVSSLGLLMEFKAAFAALGQVYLADGHHRLASAALMHGEHPQWISSLYYPESELEIGAFHRLVRRTGEEFAPDLLNVLADHYYVSAIPANRPYRPDRKGRLGMCLKGSWYQLDPKGKVPRELSDAELLQRRILGPGLGISEPREDARLECYGEADWKKMLLETQKDPLCVAFTLCPIGVEELLELSGAGRVLPPKSTYITPKAPFGLLMYHSGALAEKGDGQ